MYRRGLLVISVVLCASAVAYGQQIRVRTPWEGGGAWGYGGGPVRSGPRGSTPRGPSGYSNSQIERMERLRNGQEVVRTIQDVWRERAQREAEARESYMNRLAARATSATQPSRLSGQLGYAPRIERRDLTRAFTGYRDSYERSRSDNSSRSGGSSSSRGESKSWQEANRERRDRVGQ